MFYSFSRRLAYATLITVFIVSTGEVFGTIAPTSPKKIVVVWSKGGKAHESMLKALDDLGDGYTLIPLNPFDSLWTADDAGREATDEVINDLASILNLPPLNGKAVYNLFRHRDLASSLTLGFEMAKWLGKSPKNTLKLLFSYKDLVQENLSGLSDTINEIASKGGEDFYNFLLRNDQIELANSLFKKTAQDIVDNEEMVEERFKDYFESEKPDLVISVMPLFNSVIYKATEALEIPFLLIAPDFDISEHYFPGAKPANSKHFKYTLPLKDASLERKIEKAGIPKELCALHGFPLRSHFLEPKDKTELKEQFNIPFNKPVIMLLAGGSGAYKMQTHLEHLMHTKYPIHIIACSSTNDELAQAIEEYAEDLPDHITLTHVPYMEKISDMMAVSDVLITKSGPSSLCEAFQLQIPVIVDATSTILDWEKSHVNLVEKRRLGKVIRNMNELDSALDTIFHDKKYIDQVKASLTHFDNSDFIVRLKELIAQTITQSESKKSLGTTIVVSTLVLASAVLAVLKQRI